MSNFKDWTVLSSVPTLHENQSSSASFFAKHDLGNGLTGCSFKNPTDDVTSLMADTSSMVYELGMIKIPMGFIHVNYDLDIEAGKVTVNSTHLDESLKLKSGILTPLLLPKDAAITANHICNNIKKEPTVLDSDGKNETKAGSVEGCATIISGRPRRPFELFYYNNKMLHDDKIVRIAAKNHILATETTDLTAKVTRGEYFLIPILLSEKTVVYYAINRKENGDDKENWLGKVSENLTTFYKDVSDYAGTPPKRLAEIIQPLVLSDHLGIWVTTDIKLYEAELPSVPTNQARP